MKKLLLIISVSLVIFLSLQNCRRDPPVNIGHNTESDTAYIGTPYPFPKPFNFPPIPLVAYADSMTYEGVALGRRLFYDKHLSADGQKSCASCHKLQYALCDSGNALSTNEFGSTTRNAPALQNLAWQPYFFWDGRAPTPAAQAQNAFQHEMGLNVAGAISYLQTDAIDVRLFKKAFGRPGTITSNNIYLAIEQFVLSAVSNNSHFDRVQEGVEAFTLSEDTAFTMFFNEQGDCFHCHFSGGNTLLLTNNTFQNNGLDSVNSIQGFKDPGRGGITGNEFDYGTFKVPTLRNVAVSGPYMHDGRYKTLKQVIAFYSDSLEISPNVNFFILKHFDTLPDGTRLQHGGLHLTASQQQDMVDLLNGMTDTSFMNNPNLKDPFVH
jgi:cytochrome c peroxidase